MTVFQSKTTFGRGEVAPGLYDRADVEFYRSAAKRVENWFPELVGGVFVRPGFDPALSSTTGEASNLLNFLVGDGAYSDVHLGVITVDEVDYVVLFHEWERDTGVELSVWVFRIDERSDGKLEHSFGAQAAYDRREGQPSRPLSERVSTAVVGPSMFVTLPGYRPMRIIIDPSDGSATVEEITWFEELLGTVEVDNGSTTWQGTDTLFDEQLASGDTFRFRGDTYTVDTITNNTEMTTEETYQGLSVAGVRIEQERDPDEVFGGSYPRLCAFDKGRLHLFSTRDNPTKWWASRAQDPFVIIPGSVYDDAPIEYELLTADADTFLWVFASDRLYLGGARGEYVIDSAPDRPLTPTEFGFRRVTTVGSIGVQPQFTDASLIFINRAGTQVMTSSFSDDVQGFLAEDISLLASHLMQEGIKSLAYRPPVRFDRSPRLFALTRQNNLRACAFSQQQDVAAWSRVTTEGPLSTEAIAASSDRLYVLNVLREDEDGDTRTRVFLTTLGNNTDRYFTMDFSVDLTPASGVVTVPEILEDRTVAVVSENRGFLGYFDVEGDELDLTDEADDIGEVTVGVPFANEIDLLPVQMDDDRGGTLNRKHRIVRALVSVQDSRQVFLNGEPIFGSIGSILGQELEPQTGTFERRLLGWVERDELKVESASIYNARLLSVTREVNL